MLKPSNEIKNIIEKPIFFNEQIQSIGNTFNIYPEGSLQPNIKLNFV